MFNIYSRRQILKVGGGLIVGATAAGSFPLIRTLAAGRPKTVLRFKFTIEGGGKGSFDFNTAPPKPGDPPVEQRVGAFGPEFLYFNAVSDFSFSGVDRDLKKESAGWKVVPGLTANRIGLPDGTPGVLSGVNYPNGCTTGSRDQPCSVTVAVLYLGNLAELPELSTDPDDYRLVGIDLIDPNGQLNRINATDSKVIALPDKVDN
ncbi:MAG: hypothetical protein KME22_03720 [Hassallia sp. WJT32-NPBG1]|nr:hypothetical protein [Hassallia sp. WJT32-NPBG1]